MSGFLYFTEEATRPVSPEDVDEWGLGYAFDGRPASTDLRGRTPSGGNGWLFGDQVRLGNAPFGYRPESQKWRQIPKSPVWLGFSTELLPGPESLQRAEQLDGELVTLTDGFEWLIPRLRFWAGDEGYQTALPVKANLNDEGEWVFGESTGQGARLEAISARLFQGMWESLAEGSTEKPLSIAELLDTASELIGVNYVVSRVEVAALGLLTNDALLSRIARVAMDFDRAMEWAQKKTEESDHPAVAGAVA